MEHESDGDTNCNQYTLCSHQKIVTRNGGIGNKSTIGEHSNYSIIKNSQNTEKSPEDLRRLGLTQTLAEKHQLTLVEKSQKWAK